MVKKKTPYSKYPNKDVYITKAGRVYIGVEKGKGITPIIARSKKAIKTASYGWIPNSASFIKSHKGDERYGTVYIAESFYNKLEAEGPHKREIDKHKRRIKKQEKLLTDARKEIPANHPFFTQETKVLKKLKKDLQWVIDNPI